MTEELDMKTEEEEFLMLRIKLENRRVSLGRMENGNYGIEFKMLDREQEKGERVRITRLRLSEEAMQALAFLYTVYDEKINYQQDEM